MLEVETTEGWELVADANVGINAAHPELADDEICAILESKSLAPVAIQAEYIDPDMWYELAGQA